MLLIGFLISFVVAYGAYRRAALNLTGAMAAVAVGTVIFGLGGSMAGMALLGFFLTGTALSRYRKGIRAEDPEHSEESIIEKGDCRDAIQVLANGGPAAGFCLLFALTGAQWAYVGALGALAAAAADTWATEIGMMAGGTPRDVLTLKEVPAGTSGAVSVVGLWGMAGGAAFVALLTLWEPGVGTLLRTLVITLAGCAGGMIDSILGATVQERRSCLSCHASTEQHRHSCGGETVQSSGVAGIDNDTVNGLATALGGAAAALLWAVLVGR